MQNLPEMYRPVVESLVKHMRTIMAGNAELDPVVFLGNVSLKKLLFTPMLMTSEMDKDVSAALVSAIAEVFKADFAILVSESWSLPKETTPDEAMKLLKQYGQIQSCPNRVETVRMTLETLNGNWLGMSPIKTLDNGQRGFDDLEFIKADDVGGRFSHFLTPHPTVH